MKLIIGLGNPGEKYIGTRHNVGFAMLDKIQREFGLANFEFNKKFNAEISSGDYQLPASTRGDDRSSMRGGPTTNQKLILVKPQTFMNLSGETVRAILDFYKLTAEDIVVIQDDLDIELGTYKVATDSRAAGHNGVQNIIDQLGTQKFKRVRIGLGKITTDEPACRLGAHDFVLGKFTAEEKEKIEKISTDILNEIKKLLQ
ncbi:MAG: aminoacyl-tRNA hydrolase [Candidatus Moranbacteria bacterium]|nr:aminoacyl-tRNA hydrolase [Candidatus Moranbacteria bacterium]